MKVILQAFDGKLQSDVIDIEESPDGTYRTHFWLCKQSRLYGSMNLHEAKESRREGGVFADAGEYPGYKVALFEDTGKIVEDAKYDIKIYELVDITESP